jgi:hypothetical protein
MVEAAKDRRSVIYYGSRKAVRIRDGSLRNCRVVILKMEAPAPVPPDFGWGFSFRSPHVWMAPTSKSFFA